MKQLFALLALTLILAACSKEDQPREPAAEQAPDVAEQPDVDSETVAETVEEAAEETMEVVEESAAVDAQGNLFRSPAVKPIRLLDRLGGGDTCP